MTCGKICRGPGREEMALRPRLRKSAATCHQDREGDGRLPASRTILAEELENQHRHLLGSNCGRNQVVRHLPLNEMATEKILRSFLIDPQFRLAIIHATLVRLVPAFTHGKLSLQVWPLRIR